MSILLRDPPNYSSDWISFLHSGFLYQLPIPYLKLETNRTHCTSPVESRIPNSHPSPPPLHSLTVPCALCTSLTSTTIHPTAQTVAHWNSCGVILVSSLTNMQHISKNWTYILNCVTNNILGQICHLQSTSLDYCKGFLNPLLLLPSQNSAHWN